MMRSVLRLVSGTVHQRQIKFFECLLFSRDFINSNPLLHQSADDFVSINTIRERNELSSACGGNQSGIAQNFYG